MKKLPRWAIITLGVVVVLVILALVVPLFIDVDRYRTVITSAIEKETGRKATIGKISARLIPRVGFVVSDVALGNPASFPEGNFLTAESLRGNLAWGPLFRREFQLSSIEIVNPRVVLAENERGQTNYDLTSKPAPRGKAQPAEESAFKLADIDSITISGAQLVMARVSGRRIIEEVEVRNLSARLTDVALDAKRIKQWKADADAAGVEMRIPGFRNPIVFRSGELTLREGAVDSKFELGLGDAFRARGSMRVPNIEKAVVQFELSAPLLDLDALTAEGVDTPASSASAPPPRGTGSELLARGRVSADRIVWKPYEGTKASAEVRLLTDRIEIWPATMAFYDGSFGVSARIDRRSAPARFSANIEVQGLDMAKILAASPASRGMMTGVAAGKLQLNGQMGPKMMDSLTGPGDLAIREGSFPKFSLANVMGSLGKVAQFLGGGGGSSGGTPFRSITADMNVGGGRISSNRIYLDSPAGAVEMRGWVGFNQALNYNGQATLTRAAAGEARQPTDAIMGAIGGALGRNVDRLSVPFALRGTFQDIKVQPGRGLPSATQSQPATEEKKKSILDIFRKPPSP